jgi:small subunit ribosomal protein S1
MTEDGGFASMFEDSQPRGAARSGPKLEAGQQVEGTVLAVSAGLVIVDIGGSADATLDLAELDGRSVSVGDKLRATVANPRKDGPLLTLSLGRGGSTLGVDALRLALEGGTPVSGTVTAAVKGGFSVEVAGVRAFCPISQIEVGFVTEPDTYVGQTFDFQVIELRDGGRSVVVSRRKLLEEQRKLLAAEVAQSLEVGATVRGTIKGTVRQGAIVELGGLEGFIHVSELSRSRVERPEDAVTIGEEVEAKVLSIERGERGLSVRLSLKALGRGPAAPEPKADEILEAKVTRHVGNGLIVATSHGEGLVPVRELALAPGSDHKRAYPVGHALQVVLVSRDASSGRLRFSVERVAGVEEQRNLREFGSSGSGSLGSLGDLLKGRFDALAAGPKAAQPTSKVAGGPDQNTTRRRRV